MWSDQEKKIQKIDRLARSLLIQGLSNDIYCLIDSNKNAKDLWDALARHLLGSKYGEQVRKAAVLYEYETFKATEGELLLDTYIRYLQVINDLKKCENKNLMDINIDALYNIIKQNQGDVTDSMGLKKKTVVVTSDPLALIAEKTKVSKRKEKVVVSSDYEGSDVDDFSELKKITALLANAFNRRKFYSKPTNNNLRLSSNSQFANKKQEFVKTDNKKVEKKDDEKKRDMSKIKCYNCKMEGHFAKDCKKVKVKDYEYYKTKMLLAKKNKDEKKVISDSETSLTYAADKISEVSYYLSESESESEYETSEYYDNTTYAIDHNNSEGVDKLIRKFNKKIVKCLKRIEKANQKNKDFENQNKDLQDKYDVLKNQATTFEMNNKELNEQLKVLIEKNDDLLTQTNVLKDQLQVKHVVIDTHVECQEKYAKLEAERYEHMIRYSAYFDNDKQRRKQIADQEVLYDKMSVQLIELDKHVRDLKNTVLEKDVKIFELEECQTNQTVNMIMPSKDNMYNARKGIGFENPSYFCKAKDLRPTLYDERVINLGYTLMFLTHFDEALEIEKFKRAIENKIGFAYDYGSLNASYVNEKINFSDVYFQEIINPDFDKIDSPFQQTSSLNQTSSAYVCNDVMNVSCNSRMCDSFDENNLFIFDDESVRISPVSKMPFRKKPRDSLNVCSKSNSNKSLPRAVHRWLPKMQLLAEPVDKWIPKIVHSCLWIIDSGCSTHMTGNRALLKNFVEKFLGTVRFGNNDFAVIAGYGDVVIGLMTIKKVYYVEDGVDFLTSDRSSNLYTIALNEVASNSSTCLLAKASSSSKEVRAPSSNTQSISKNMVPNDDEVSTSHNVFNEHLEDAYFDASTSFHDPSNVHTFYQPYLHEKKWTKDHPLHKIISDPKSSVRTRALRDADWVSAMQEELDQFARLKVWRLVPRPEGKTIIKTKWIFKNKKDESSLVIQNKARLIAVGYSQQEGIDYDETFAQEEVYVGQPLVPTPMVEQAKLKLDLVGKPVDHTDYRSMIGLLMYVTSSRPDIMFATYMYARYLANPNEHYVSAVKRIFRYLKRTINLGLWYLKDSSFDLTAYSYADHAGCHLDRKSTSGSVQFLGDKLVCWSSKKQNCVSISTSESKYVAVSS
nr:uncharacterized mitochondrial protein AtMg00810-like [Tanacetum cinerariifolium]